MVKHSLGDTSRFVNSEWHRRRNEARRSFSIDEFGPQEIERYDLDNITFDRVMKPYTSDSQINAEGGSKSGHYLYKPGYMD